MGDLTPIIQAYLEIGFLGLAAAFVIYFCIYQIKHGKDNEKDIIKMYTQIIKTMQAQHTQMMANSTSAIENVAARINSHTISPEENKTIQRMSTEVDKQLNLLLLDTKSSRVGLIQYHNGNRNLNRTSFLKMSITNEKTRLGVKPFLGSFKDQFRSVLQYIITECDVNDYVLIDDMKAIEEIDNGTYCFLVDRNVKHMFGISVHGRYDEPIGYIFIEYEDNNPRTIEIDEIKKYLSIYRERIQTILNLKNEEDE